MAEVVQSDRGEDRAPCYASQSHRWRVMIMHRQTEGREGCREGGMAGELGIKRGKSQVQTRDVMMIRV